MNSKKLIWLGLFVGSAIGSYIPKLWGDGLFSFASLVLGAVGAFVGIWFGYKIGK